MGHTYDNLELAPKLACRMATDLITDCIKVERNGESGGLLCTKPIYGGNAVAVLQVDARPQIVTMRSKAVNAMEKCAFKGQITVFDCELAPSLALTESLGLVPGESVSLDKADAIVAGGRGVKSADGVADLMRLVAALGNRFDTVELGASRSLVDAGLLSHSRQIGQTGEKVSPRVYVAVAISGAAQHMAGVVGAGKIIAINKDADAPIFGVSDYGVVGYFEAIVPALVKSLEELP
jgi:electron transfer flavoprotein alpha subunit